jgi:hypothetical protein
MALMQNAKVWQAGTKTGIESTRKNLMGAPNC